ncbi:MAG: sulfurtransferase TusA family protein [Breznakibacter sp.]
MYNLPTNHLADIELFEEQTKEFLQGHAEPVRYKAIRVPMGIYEQRADGTYMVRIRCAGGYITPAQLEGVADIAGSRGLSVVHLTTRQELQIQQIDLADTPCILRQLHHLGLSTKGGGGNTVRNIMASVGTGIDADEVFDVTPYAHALTSFMIARNDSFSLPRKFKISFSNSERDTAMARFNDLGFVARIRDGRRGFGVFLGGSLGNKPMVGYELFNFIPAAETALVAEAAKQLFNQFGNRRNRHKARLRFLFYKLGRDEVFRLFGSIYKQLKQSGEIGPLEEDLNNAFAPAPHLTTGFEYTDDFLQWKKRYARTVGKKGTYVVVVPFTNGNTNPVTLKSIARFANLFGHDAVRLSMRQAVHLRHVPPEFLPNLYKLLKGLKLPVDQPAVLNHIISCTGADTCRLGICLSKGAVQALRSHLSLSGLPLDEIPDLKINISGCPNSCGQQMAADLGFYGKVGRNDRIYPAYYVVGGASLGENTSLARPLGEVAARDLPAFTSRLLYAYTAGKEHFAGFADFLEQEKDRTVAGIFAEFAHIPSYEKNKDYYRDWGVEKTFSLAGRGQGECAAGMFDMIDVDMKYINRLLEVVERSESPRPEDVYNLVFYSSRMLLVTKGVEPNSVQQVFQGFIDNFIDAGLVDAKYMQLLRLALQHGSTGKLALQKETAVALGNAVISLYDQLDNTLQLSVPVPPYGVLDKAPLIHKDLRGVACPMNFVKTKIELSSLKPGDILEILLDDGAPIQNVPASVAGEGHKVLSQQRVDGHWAVVIEKVDI